MKSEFYREVDLESKAILSRQYSDLLFQSRKDRKTCHLFFEEVTRPGF